MLAMTELMGCSYEIAAERKKNPADDIISRLVAADADGDALSEIEFGYFMLLLLVAGNETTRNATSAGMVALLNHPAQWELYKRTRPERWQTRSSAGQARSTFSNARRARIQ